MTASTTDNQKWQYSPFGAILAISGCPSLSQSLGDTFIELTMVNMPDLLLELR